MAIPFALAWNGFVVFLVVSLVSAALGGDGAVPAGPGENPEAVARPVAEPHDGPAAPANGDAEPAESPAEAAKTGLPWFVPVIGGVFLVPFVAVGLYELCMVVMLVCGEERVSVRQDRGEVFSGAGALGRRRTFDWGSVRRVTQWSHSVPFGIGLPGASRIVLEGGRRIVFGKSLGAERAAFVGSALAAMLAERDGRQRGTF